MVCVSIHSNTVVPGLWGQWGTPEVCLMLVLALRRLVCHPGRAESAPGTGDGRFCSPGPREAARREKEQAGDLGVLASSTSTSAMQVGKVQKSRFPGRGIGKWLKGVGVLGTLYVTCTKTRGPHPRLGAQSACRGSAWFLHV